MIVLPGIWRGEGPSVHKGVRKQLLTFAREGKGIDHLRGPMILGELGILEGKSYHISRYGRTSHRSRTYRRRCSKRPNIIIRDWRQLWSSLCP
ncbi:MAG: hypothetical protein ACLTK0_11185 [Anaerovoracaceae bacterium]